jgi:hypothetical protein
VIDDTLLEAEDKMDKAIEVAKEDFAGIRTGRASAGMFAKISVDYYGAPTPLQQLASFNNPEARTILVSPFDKSATPAIEKAIRDSDLGVNPATDGNVIRVAPRRSSTASSVTARPARTRSRARRRSSSRSPRSTSTRSTCCWRARRTSCSRSDGGREA